METLLPPEPAPDPKLMLGGIVIANVLLPHHRIGRYLLYPLSFLSTWAHEMGHVLATMISGGRVQRVEIYANLAGKVTSKRPRTLWAAFLSPTLGLLGPSVAGAVIIVGGTYPRGIEWILEGLGALVVISAMIWVRNPFGVFFSAVVGGGILYLSTLPGRLATFWLIQALGVRFAVESLSDFRYLFAKEAGENQPSDTAQLAQHFLIPHWAWGILIGSLSVCILAGALYLAWGDVVVSRGIRKKMGLP